jgi:hypothetical protein
VDLCRLSRLLTVASNLSSLFFDGRMVRLAEASSNPFGCTDGGDSDLCLDSPLVFAAPSLSVRRESKELVGDLLSREPSTPGGAACRRC